jgi:hypothetical protein
VHDVLSRVPRPGGLPLVIGVCREAAVVVQQS